jgi:hypothetical protein
MDPLVATIASRAPRPRSIFNSPEEEEEMDLFDELAEGERFRPKKRRRS